MILFWLKFCESVSFYRVLDHDWVSLILQKGDNMILVKASRAHSKMHVIYQVLLIALSQELELVVTQIVDSSLKYSLRHIYTRIKYILLPLNSSKSEALLKWIESDL